MLDLFISVLRTDWFVREEFVGTLPSPRTLQLPTLPYPCLPRAEIHVVLK